MKQYFKSILAVLALVIAVAYSASQNQNKGPTNASQRSDAGELASDASGDFDFYVLSLSWSPTYCTEKGNGATQEQQCTAKRPFAFVLHGLWPQNETGWPENCTGDYPERIDSNIADEMLDIMPSRSLVFHEWKKHGRCSGLSPENYFALSRKALAQVSIPDAFTNLASFKTVKPDDVEMAFKTANPKLQSNAIAVTCSNRYLREVRICMNKALSFRPCPEVDGQSCRAAKTIMPPVRGS